MKRFLVTLLLLTLTASIALAEIPDFSSMSFEELQEAKAALEKEYYSRPEIASRKLYPGVYYVGKDIYPGDYSVVVTEIPETDRSFTYFALYANEDDYNSMLSRKFGKSIVEAKAYFGDQPKALPFSEGNVLYIGSGELTLTRPNADVSSLYEYEPPEGTFIPAGDYHVGADIPEGSYYVYATDPNAAEFGIYYSEESYSDHAYYHNGMDESYSLYVSQTKPYQKITLKEGYVFYAKTSVVMQKAQKLNFD